MCSFKMTQVCFNVTLQSAGRSQCSCRCDVSFSIQSTHPGLASQRCHAASNGAMGQWTTCGLKGPPLEPQTMGSVSKRPLVFLLAGSQRRQLKEPPLQQQNGCRLSVLVLCWGGSFRLAKLHVGEPKTPWKGHHSKKRTPKMKNGYQTCYVTSFFFLGGGVASSQPDS